MRAPVPLRHAYRLLNHGPTTLISAAAGGRANVMAAAWVMPLDLDPPKIALVLSSDSFTRSLVDASGELAVSIPTQAMVDLVFAVGNESGAEVDKIARHAIATSAGAVVAAPLVDGCVGWLEARVLPNEPLAKEHDLLLAEVVAAWADPAVFRDGEWHFDDDRRRTIHHVARGAFFATGPRVEAAR